MVVDDHIAVGQAASSFSPLFVFSLRRSSEILISNV